MIAMDHEVLFTTGEFEFFWRVDDDVYLKNSKFKYCQPEEAT